MSYTVLLLALLASAESVTGYLCRDEASAIRILAAEASDAKSGERSQDIVGHELLTSGTCSFFDNIQLYVVYRGKSDAISKASRGRITGYAREGGGMPELFGVVEIEGERAI